MNNKENTYMARNEKYQLKGHYHDRKGEGRTHAYIGTFNYHCPRDVKKIQVLREWVNLESDGRKRLKLQGRLGKNRPAEITEKYRNKRGPWHVALQDSGYVDAYVYYR